MNLALHTAMNSLRCAVLTGLLCIAVAGCESTLSGGRVIRDAPGTDSGVALDARAPLDAPIVVADSGVTADSGAAEDLGGVVEPPLGPPLSRPPAGPPDHASIVAALASERPDLVAGSCVAMGGTNGFLFEAVRRLLAVDRRYGLVMRAGALTQDRVGYFWGAGAPEGSGELFVLDIIQRHCARAGVDAPAAAGWGDDTAGGGTWTILPLGGVVMDVDAGTPIDLGAPMMLPLPDARDVVNAVAAAEPALLAASCVADGGNNDWLYELVRTLRRMDVRWGLNWKRGRVGDMSQDVITYYYGAGAPYESAPEIYVIDIIGGHCGPSPSPAWIDVTGVGGASALWTLNGRTDLGP